MEKQVDSLLYKSGYDKSEILSFSFEEKVVILNSLNLIPKE